MTDDLTEFERLRRLIPERPDFHLDNWGRWRRGYHLTEGYDQRSAGLQNLKGSGEDASEHSYEALCGYWAEVSDAILTEFPINYRIAICQVYEASVWKFGRGNLDQTLIDAAALFWEKAQRRGLI